MGRKKINHSMKICYKLFKKINQRSVYKNKMTYENYKDTVNCDTTYPNLILGVHMLRHSLHNLLEI